jgi:hypothetical protein
VIEVIGIFVAAGDGEHARMKNVGDAVGLPEESPSLRTRVPAIISSNITDVRQSRSSGLAGR